ALNDGDINRAVREIDRLCHTFIVRHLPSAGHLRLMSATIRAVIALERIGDYAVSISREAVQIASLPDNSLARLLEIMGNESADMLRQALAAFKEGNADKAKGVMGMADQMERHLTNVFHELTHEEAKRPIKDLFALFVVFSLLERVSDQAKNLCEETVFAVTGETKAAKVYRVLFLDEANDCQSQMAQAIGRKTFPNSGVFESAGRTAAGALDAGMTRFMEEHGCSMEEARPRKLDMTPTELGAYHVIVSLQGPVRDYLDEIPFHTTALQWDVGDAPSNMDDIEAGRSYEEMYRKISVELRVLLEKLRGPGAD
ncbi:MAG: PhoU domain-containing protein, partial [Pseudomonadota bacterium]